MLNDLKKEAGLVKLLLVLLIIAVGIHIWTIAWQVLQNFSDVILVLVFAWLLSFALEPIVDFISINFKLPRIWSAIATYLLFTIIIALIIYYIIPPIEEQILKLLNLLPSQLHGTPPFMQKWILTFTSSLNSLLYSFVYYIPYFANILFLFFITLLVSFYLVVDKINIQKELYSLTPGKWHKNMQFIQEVIDRTFASFIRVQLM